MAETSDSESVEYEIELVDFEPSTASRPDDDPGQDSSKAQEESISEPPSRAALEQETSGREVAQTDEAPSGEVPATKLDETKAQTVEQLAELESESRSNQVEVELSDSNDHHPDSSIPGEPIQETQVARDDICQDSALIQPDCSDSTLKITVEQDSNFGNELPQVILDNHELPRAASTDPDLNLDAPPADPTEPELEQQVVPEQDISCNPETTPTPQSCSDKEESTFCELFVEQSNSVIEPEVTTAAYSPCETPNPNEHLAAEGPTETQANTNGNLTGEISSGVKLTLNISEVSAAEVESVSTPRSDAPTEGQCADDLERELEGEPAFEPRQVLLKRGRDPRSDYELGDELGRGKFGTVYRCIERASGRELAAKFVHMRRREDRQDVEREISIMSLLQHKRLLQLYDAYDDGKNEMCLITELIEGGELFERIVDDDFQLTERKAAIFVRQICEGVEYMHEQNVVHLDMKPENILCVSKTGNRIKLIDFGLARRLNSSEPLRIMFGTPDFAAPEVLSYDTVSLATDMWSVGVICYVLLSGLSPFMGDNDIETMANVTRATYDFDDEAFEPISDTAKDFIAKLLVRNQSSRLTPTQCLKHPWLTKKPISGSRRGSLAMVQNVDQSKQGTNRAESNLDTLTEVRDSEYEDEEELEPSLSKRNLKKYVIRRKWHKTVHAIMALGRMGANLKLKMATQS